MEEHLLTDGQGHFKLGGDRWESIGLIINKWHKKFPQQSRQLKQDISEARSEFKKGSRERPMRQGLLIDPLLMYSIQRFYPDFLNSNKDLRIFAEKFPQFVIDEGILPAKRDTKWPFHYPW